MRHVRWIGLLFFVAGFAATYTPYHYLWLALWGVGMVCLFIGLRREGGEA